jgi:peptidoglycan/LPS O-acetylase OafA/YrhL
MTGPFFRVHTQNELWADYGYLSCMDGIALGCLAAMFAARIKLTRKANMAFSFSGALLCLLITVFRSIAVRLAFYKAGLDVTVLEIGSALLLIALQQNPSSHAEPLSDKTGRVFSLKKMAEGLYRSTAFLRWFGRNSYEVYLTHMFAVWAMVGLFFHFHQSIHQSPLWFLATLALTGALGHVVARFYSEPLNHKLRTKLLATSPATIAASAD